jgi:hypothetical protein
VSPRATAGRIREVLARRRSPLEAEVADVPDIRDLPRGVRERVAEELTREQRERGYDPGGRLDHYGEEIQDLLDACDLGPTD